MEKLVYLRLRSCTVAVCVALGMSVSTCVIAENGEAMTADEADQLRFEIKQLQLINKNQAEMLQKMEGRLQQLETGQPAVTNQQSSQQTAGTAKEDVKKSAGPSSSVENVLQEEHVLFGDKFTIEAGFNYSHYDRKDLVLEGFLALDAIFLGDIAVDDVKADVFTFDVTGRYNVTNKWQVGMTIPYVYRNTNFQRNVSGGVEADVSETGLGDISLISAYQLYAETENSPDIVWNTSLKIPTGTDPYGVPSITKTATNGDDLTYPSELPTGSGLYSLTTGLSFVKTTDPAILFANIGYTHNFEGSFGDISSNPGSQPGKVKLGDSIHYGVGMAFVLNERTSLSMSLSQRISTESETQFDGGAKQKVIGSDGNAATFSIGATYALSDKLSMSTSLGIGLTPDAPDFALSMRFPFRF
ncbi:transporter [Aliamphritea ceti]|uniref:transporter n=1 Tax=Aliamphritea ceti TaxID=1524258 RepID=UPI0021C4257B|nr:hypothetical protein [Aliamphritea ceti]